MMIVMIIIVILKESLLFQQNSKTFNGCKVRVLKLWQLL